MRFPKKPENCKYESTRSGTLGHRRKSNHFPMHNIRRTSERYGQIIDNTAKYVNQQRKDYCAKLFAFKTMTHNNSSQFSRFTRRDCLLNLGAISERRTCSRSTRIHFHFGKPSLITSMEFQRMFRDRMRMSSSRQSH